MYLWQNNDEILIVTYDCNCWAVIWKIVNEKLIILPVLLRFGFVDYLANNPRIPSNTDHQIYCHIMLMLFDMIENRWIRCKCFNASHRNKIVAPISVLRNHVFKNSWLPETASLCWSSLSAPFCSKVKNRLIYLWFSSTFLKLLY